MDPHTERVADGLKKAMQAEIEGQHFYQMAARSTPDARGREVFETLGLRKLCCEVLDFNSAVIEMHLKLGFSREGIQRAHIVKDTGSCDVHQLAMFDEDWHRLKAGFAEELARRDLQVDPPAVMP